MNLLILVIFIGLFSTGIFLMSYKRLTMKLNKQKIEKYRYLIADILYEKKNQRIVKSQNLFRFAVNTKESLELDIDEYLNNMKMNKNISNPNSQNVIDRQGSVTTIRDEILSLIHSEQISNVEKEFINNFLSLQMYITSVKIPYRFMFLELKNYIEFVLVDKIVLKIFKLYAIVHAKMKSKKEVLTWQVGPYVFTATKKRKIYVEDILDEERSVSMLKSLKDLAFDPLCY